MRIELEEVRTWIASLKPNDPILPNDPRYVDLDRFIFQANQVKVRSGQSATLLCRGILTSQQATCQLFSGFAGTGKSTELLKLRAELHKRDYQVLLIDVGLYHDLQHSITIEDMLTILPMAIEEQVNEVTGKSQSHFLDEVKEILGQEVEFKELAKMTPLDLKLSLRSSSEIWFKIRERMRASVAVLREKSFAYIKKTLARLATKKQASAGTVLIFDSLEKLGGNDLDFKEIMLSATKLFSQHVSALRIPDCHSIYTIPPYALILNPGLGALYDGGLIIPLPAVKVRTKEGEIFKPGIEALREFVARRIEVARVFGENSEAFDKLLLCSGGHIRTLLKMVNDLILNNLEDEFPLNLEQVDEVIRSYAEYANRAIRPEAVPLLEEIRLHKDIQHVKDAEFHLLARYMDHRLVLCYQNGEGWYEVHELVRDNVKRRALEMKQQAQTSAN